jgi:hypothetical protein
MTGHRIQASAGGVPLPRHVLAPSGIITTVRRLTYVCVCVCVCVLHMVTHG